MRQRCRHARRLLRRKRRGAVPCRGESGAIRSGVKGTPGRALLYWGELNFSGASDATIDFNGTSVDTCWSSDHSIGYFADVTELLDDEGDLIGTEIDDPLTGTEGDDAIYGPQGNDRLLGLAGNDIPAGHEDDDRLVRGPGNDAARGGAGRDLRRNHMEQESEDVRIDDGAGMVIVLRDVALGDLDARDVQF